MQITLLGGFEVLIDGRRVSPTEWRRRQAAALVKLLALAPGRILHREQVMDALWPDLHLDEASPRLHKAAHYARRALGQPRSVVLGGDTVALLPDAEVDIDAVRFQRLAESARDARTAGEAVDAYPGDLLPQDLYDTWTGEPRNRLRMLYLRTLRRSGRWQDTDSTDELAYLELVGGPASAGDILSAPGQFERLAHEPRRDPRVAPHSPKAVHVRDASMHSPRRGRAPILIVGDPAARPGQPTVQTDGDWPYRRILEAVAELRRDHPTLSAGATPIAVILM